ncbi:hypothetical protein PV682_12650 [Streptomyces niveiscabiei]|uniref:hypothetical protein n=1 Tax=Streptomyces niveiscabiei TaxID=164115 RepID=UPI0029B7F8C2|nr:hypothetical protein [Streptomyces niveiscabiei]MDX3382302.1 hypothetical protein [Streptomyces niveiscabiei]
MRLLTAWGAWAQLVGVLRADWPTRWPTTRCSRGSSASQVGVRINSQAGAGSIAASSTATATSRFGIALEDDRNMRRLVRAYQEHPWLTWVHAHVGSQGCPLDTYVSHLRDHAPALCTGAYRIVTESGHSLLSRNGFTAAYVEYTKTSGGRPIATAFATLHAVNRNNASCAYDASSVPSAVRTSPRPKHRPCAASGLC